MKLATTILIIIFVVKTCARVECNFDKCSKPTQIRHNLVKREQSRWENVTIKVRRIERKGLAKMMRLTRYTSHCAYIPFEERDVMCPGRYDTIDLSYEEARTSFEEGRCKVGTSCYPEGHCWGTDATICFSQSRNTYLPPSKFDSLHTKPWYKYLYHTCTVQWQCEMREFDMQLSFDDKSASLMSVTPYGEEIKFSMGTKSIITNLNYTIMPNLFDSYTSFNRIAKCMIHNKQSICIVRMDSKDTLLRFNEKGFATTNGIMFEIHDHAELLNRKITQIMGNPESSLTLQQAREMQKGIIFDNVQAHINIALLEEEVIKLSTLYLRSILSLSTTHGGLLRDTFNISGHTLFRRGNVVSQCPCVEETNNDVCNMEITPTKEQLLDCIERSKSPPDGIAFVDLSINLLDDELPELDLNQSELSKSEIATLQDALDRRNKFGKTADLEDLTSKLLFIQSTLDGFFIKYSPYVSICSFLMSLYLLHLRLRGK